MRVPKYRKHSSRDQAFVEFHGRHYLPGKFESRESRSAYHDFLVKHCFARPGCISPTPPGAITIDMIALDYLIYAEGYYGAEKDSEFSNLKGVLAAFQREVGSVPAVEFGPKSLKDYRDKLIAEGGSRSHINWKIGRIKRCLRWATSEEKFPADKMHGIDSVQGLKEGMCAARETKKREPVPWEHVEPILPFLKPVLRAMLLLQSFTGARSGSVCRAAVKQFRRRKTLWDWKPRHKTEKTNKWLVLPIGPKCQQAIIKFFGPIEGDYLFRPKDVKNDARCGNRYTPRSYRQALHRGIRRYNRENEGKGIEKIPLWTPHQIRHLKGHQVRERFGIEGVQSVLGHESLSAAQIYSKRRLRLARKIARELG